MVSLCQQTTDCVCNESELERMCINRKNAVLNHRLFNITSPHVHYRTETWLAEYLVSNGTLMDWEITAVDETVRSLL